jgi:glutaredoxin
MTSHSRTTISATRAAFDGEAAAGFGVGDAAPVGVDCDRAVADARIAAVSESLDFLKDHTLAVYSANWCPDCQRLDRWMQEKNVPHQDVNIDRVDGAADRLELETGKQAVPFILVDGKAWVRGYHAEERTRFSESKLLAELRAAVGAGVRS